MCRSSLSSNSEGDDDMGRYSRSTFDPILSQTQTNNSNMATTPYMLSRDTGQPLGENGGRNGAGTCTAHVKLHTDIQSGH